MNLRACASIPAPLFLTYNNVLMPLPRFQPQPVTSSPRYAPVPLLLIYGNVYLSLPRFHMPTCQFKSLNDTIAVRSSNRKFILNRFVYLQGCSSKKTRAQSECTIRLDVDASAEHRSKKYYRLEVTLTQPLYTCSSVM